MHIGGTGRVVVFISISIFMSVSISICMSIPSLYFHPQSSSPSPVFISIFIFTTLYCYTRLPSVTRHRPGPGGKLPPNDEGLGGSDARTRHGAPTPVNDDNDPPPFAEGDVGGDESPSQGRTLHLTTSAPFSNETGRVCTGFRV